MTTPLEKQLQTGFTPSHGAQERVWNKLPAATPLAAKQHFAPRWALAAAVLLLLAGWAALRPEATDCRPMTAKVTMSAVAASQRFGEAGPNGLEYGPHYIPFR